MEQDANFDVRDALGWSPLKHAEVFGHKEVQELLKEFMFPEHEEEEFIGRVEYFFLFNKKFQVKKTREISRKKVLVKFHFLLFQK